MSFNLSKLIILLIFTSINLKSFTQDNNTKNNSDTLKPDTTWKTGGILSLTFAQSYVENWAAGGESFYSFNSRFNLFGNYTGKKLIWQNSLDLAYGLSHVVNTGVRKNDDLMEYMSSFGYKASKKWYYLANVNFKSQFYKGEKYTDSSSIRISDFLSPAYINFAIGMKYFPVPELEIFMSPVNNQITYVRDSILTSRFSIPEGKHVKVGLGLITRIQYKKEFNGNISILSKLSLFSDYLDTPKDVDVDWEVLLNFKVFKALTVNLNTRIIYDRDIKAVSDEWNIDPYLQLKEIFGIGLAYNLGNK